MSAEPPVETHRAGDEPSSASDEPMHSNAIVSEVSGFQKYLLHLKESQDAISAVSAAGERQATALADVCARAGTIEVDVAHLRTAVAVVSETVTSDLATLRTDIVSTRGEISQVVEGVRVSNETQAAILVDLLSRVAAVHQQLGDLSQATSALLRPPRPASRLAKVVLVLYGGVISYALYVMADSLVLQGLLAAVQAWPSPTLLVDMLVRLLLFVPVLLFLVKDLGDVVMIEARFPARRELRYLYEIVAASAYLTTFALLGRGSFLALLSFAVVLLAGALWCGELSKEYRHHPSKIAELAKTLRTLHLIGGGVFLFIVGVVWVCREWIRYHEVPLIRAIVAVVVIIAFFAWYVHYERKPRRLHGPFVRRYLLSYVRLANRVRPRRWFGDGRVH